MKRTKTDKLEVVYRTVETLIPDARNSRTHSDAQVAQIAGSIKEFGFTNPVLLDGDSGIIAGHGRVLAARKLKMVEVPCLELAHLTETQKRAYVIADNKLALNAGWDQEMLVMELGDLASGSFDLELTGFIKPEIDFMLHLDEPEAAGTDEGEKKTGSLADRFGIPPFTVLNAREGWWQDRKRAWLALGIKSELGRGAGNECAPGGGGGIWGHAGPSDFYATKANASLGGSPRPAMDYSKSGKRGDGRGRAMDKPENGNAPQT